ncbi:MAG: hypothetical protein DMG80_06490 [Acidobacteria bacterium]|nr:MAG: hypothetical protein DMG80_06490 [Acidobacteriota bacterium]
MDVELDSQGKVCGVTVVPDSQLAMEYVETQTASKQTGRNLASTVIARIGLPSLAAAGLLAAAWFFLISASVEVPFPGRLEFTFWQMLGFLNSGKFSESFDGTGGPTSGLYGCVAIIALAGPFVQLVWKDRRALFGGFLPLLFIVAVGIAIRANIHGEIRDQSHLDSLKSLSPGLGAYLSMLIGLYFAFVSARGLAARPRVAKTLTAKPSKAA